jgi:thermitase
VPAATPNVEKDVPAQSSERLAELIAAGKAHYVPGRLVVGFREAAPRLQGLALPGARVESADGGSELAIVDVAPGSEAEALSRLGANPAVAFVERDFRVRVNDFSPTAAALRKAKPRPVPGLIPNDPEFGKQWGLLKINAPNAWTLTKGSPRVTVAVLDSGIDQDHEDVSRKVLASRNFTQTPSVDDVVGHGTHVAGIIAATTNNGTGVAGTGFNVTLLNAKVVDDDGFADVALVANGIIWAVNRGAKVLNMSFAAEAGSQALERAVKVAVRRGAVLVASAGNDGTAAAMYPAAYSETLAVGATDQEDERADFSNFGAGWVDVAAPGDAIYSTGPNHPNGFALHSYDYLSGTSMSAAFVSGQAALLFSKPAILPVRWRIERSAARVPGTGTDHRYGRIDLFKSLKTL